MSGTTSLSLTQQWHNATHEPLVGGLLYSFQAGTLTPQNAYRTAALAVGDEFPNPVVLDASGRIPQMFYMDGVVRLILSDRLGVAQFDFDNIPVIGSAEGGGGVDTTATDRLYNTGDMKIRYGIGTITGYVRGNGRTIGNALSSATEYANDGALALFQYFWNTDTLLTVVPSRGASAAADWAANKAIATPDFRGYAIGGLDGMGSTRKNNLAGGKWDIIGQAIGGLESHTLTLAQTPSHDHAVSVTSVSVSGSYAGGAQVTLPSLGGSLGFVYTAPGASGGGITTGSGFGVVQAGSTTITVNSGSTATASGTSSGSWDNNPGTGSAVISQSSRGSGTSHPIVQPTRLITVYFRL